MTERLKQKKIRALFGLTKMPDGPVRPLLESSLKGLTDNATTFPKPPVDLATYKNAKWRCWTDSIILAFGTPALILLV